MRELSVSPEDHQWIQAKLASHGNQEAEEQADQTSLPEAQSALNERGYA